MKTSKKLLSFFLAVVMVVSSCTVGLTAFAKSETDANRSYWNNTSNESDAFVALNNLVDAYLPMLLNNPSIKPQIEGALGITITDQTTLSDLVAGVSPLLVGALSSASKKDVIPNYDSISELKYAYLEPQTNGAMDFYQLYNFCKVMSTAISDSETDPNLVALRDYAKATLPELEKLFTLYDEEVKNVSFNAATATTAFQNIMGQFMGVWLNEIAAATPENPNAAVFWGPDQLGQIEITYYGQKMKISDIPFTNDSDIKFFSDIFNTMYAQIGVDVVIDSAPKAFHYGMFKYLFPVLSRSFIPDLNSLRALYLITTAGEQVTAANGEKIDMSNYKAVLTKEYPLSQYLVDAQNGMTIDAYNALVPDEKAKIDSAYDYAIMARLGGYIFDKRDGTESFMPNTLDFYSSYYATEVKGILKLIDPNMDVNKAVNDALLTDEQILAVAQVAKNSWTNNQQLDAYLQEATCVFSSPVKASITSLIQNDRSLLSESFAKLGEGAMTLDEFKAVVGTDNAESIGSLPLVERINNSISSFICVEKLGKNYNYSDRNKAVYVNIDAVLSAILDAKSASQNIIADGKGFNYENYKVATLPSGETVELTSNMMVDAVNLLLNDKVNGIFGPDFVVPVNDIVNSLLSTPVNLQLTLQDLWKDLYENPVAAIFNLAPLLTILIDELLVPIVFTENDTYMANSFNQIVAGMLFNPAESGIDAPLYKFTLDSGNTDVGVFMQQSSAGQQMFSFDLNKILPGILDYILNVENSQYVADLGTYDGLVPNGASVPRFVNIYAADKAIADVVVGEKLINLLTNNFYNSALAKAEAAGPVTEEQKTALRNDAATNANGVNEIVKTVGTTLNGAVHDYFAAGHGNEERHMTNGNALAVSQRGLNNLFVALPQLIDYLGKSILTKYEIKGSDWTSVYPGKIVDVQVTSGDGTTATDKRNSTNEAFKALTDLSGTTKEENGKKILSQVITIAIGNWMNGLIDYVNDIVSDKSDTNKIVNELPLVFGLLDAIGGLGERSLITDIVDGLFQLKRTDLNSFAITEQSTTKYKGFSNEAGLFLICNLQFEASITDSQGVVTKEQRGIIPLVTNILGNTANRTSAANTLSAPSAKSSVASAGAPYAANAATLSARAASNDAELLSVNNITDANKLVAKLDTLLSTLLSDITLNGKNVTDINGVTGEIATMLAPYIGTQNAKNVINIITSYVNIVVNNDYTDNTLSAFVVDTYSTLEKLIMDIFYVGGDDVTKMAPVLPQDTDRLVADAITGIISPDSVSIRLSGGSTGNYKDTFDVLQNNANLNWFDLKETQDGGTNNVLKFHVSNEDEFFNAMAESFGGITALFGAVLTRTVVEGSPNWSASSDNANVKNLYSEIYYPLMSGIFSNVLDSQTYNNSATSDAQRLVGSFINPINGLIKSLFLGDAKPATALLNVIASLGNVLDDAKLAKIVNGLLGVIDDEINGFTGIVGNLSPTFQNELKAGINAQVDPIKNQINSFIVNEDGSQKSNILVGIINSVLKLSYGIEIPNINWNKLSSTQGNAGATLLVVFDYAVRTITSEPIFKLLLQAKYPGLIDILKSLTASQIINIFNQILDEVQDPTEIYWAFTEYANELQNKFVYPRGIFASDATKAVSQLDNIVKNIFPLLKELGVLDVDSLAALLNNMAFTNANLTTLAKTLYGALNGKIGTSTMTIADITKAFGIDPSPAGVAAYLTNPAYGVPFESAANTLKGVNNWNDVKSINWGFTDGSAMAQTGFVNGLAAILRPLNNILAMLLANGQLTVDTEGLVATISAIDTKLGNVGVLKNGVITITVEGNKVEIALANTVREIATIINDGKIHVTSNAYESAIVPLLEALTITGFKTYNDYLVDYRNAKDNLLINILNPLLGFVNEVVASPFDKLTEVLPNLALFVDGYGISQFLNNLLAPIVSDNGIVGILNKNGLNIDTIIAQILGTDLATYLQSENGPLKVNVGLELELTNLEKCNIHKVLIPLVNHFLKDTGITLVDINWQKLAALGEITTAPSAAKNADGSFTTRKVVNVNKGETLITLLRYISNVLINNAKSINSLLANIDGIKKNDTLKSILGAIFDQIDLAQADDIIRAIFFFLLDEGQNAYFNYSGFTYEEYDFSFGNMDEAFCRQLGPMLDGLVGGMINLGDMVTENVYKDEIITTIATGLYKAVEGVTVSKEIGSLTHLLSLTGIDFTTANVANLLVDEAYGQKYEDASKVIKAAGSWANVKAESLKWGVTDRDTFVHALAAVLRPVYGVLDVLLNNGSLNIFNLVSIPGSDGYTSFLVPLMEAFGLYNIKTQYQYREDIFNEYDNILLDVINPLLDKVEDILAAPIETLTDILPNLALVFANGGLLQIINNLLTPVSAILNAIRPIVDANKLLDALNVDIPGMLSKVGIKANVVVDVYDLPGTLTPLLGAASVTDLLNGVLSTIKVGGAPLGIVLPQINWYQLASHGEVILDGTSQVACNGMRIYVKADQDETLIALLRFLVNTVNYEANYDAICGLVGGLIGGADASVSDMVGQVLGMLQGDADAVIEDIVSLLQDLAG